MAIVKIYNLNFRGIKFISGHFYNLGYTRYENDPSPLILFMYANRGTHPNTGHRHNYIQGWNLSYVPIKIRRPMVRDFVRKNINIQTQQPKKQIRLSIDYFPAYLDVSFRRYLLGPGVYIRNPREIEYEIIDAELAKIAHKDFFTRAQIQRVRRLLHGPMFRVKKPKKRPKSGRPPKKRR